MMTLWKPFRTDGARSLERQIDQLFRDFAMPSLEWKTAPAAPAADIVESKDAFIVTLDLPGHEVKDIQVKVENDVLTVSSERKSAKEEEGRTFHRSEICYGAYSRSFTLPETVDSSKVEAKYEGGVLRISLPKREEVKPRSVQVKVAG